MFSGSFIPNHNQEKHYGSLNLLLIFRLQDYNNDILFWCQYKIASIWTLKTYQHKLWLLSKALTGECWNNSVLFPWFYIYRYNNVIVRPMMTISVQNVGQRNQDPGCFSNRPFTAALNASLKGTLKIGTYFHSVIFLSMLFLPPSKKEISWIRKNLSNFEEPSSAEKRWGPSPPRIHGEPGPDLFQTGAIPSKPVQKMFIFCVKKFQSFFC